MKQKNKIEIEGSTVKVHLFGKYGNGKVALCDLEDWEKYEMDKYRWTCDPASYVIGRKKGEKDVLMHTLVMDNTDSTLFVDHIFHNPLDNRKQSLRICSNQQNQFNARIRKDNKTGYKCVSCRNGKYRTLMKIDGVKYSFGTTYDKPEQAALAYNLASRVLHGEFAYLNSIPDGVLSNEEIEDIFLKVDKILQDVQEKIRHNRMKKAMIKGTNTYNDKLIEKLA